jgi:hypothetical protein
VPELTADDIRAMVTQFGDMAKVVDRADRNDLAELYEALGLGLLMTIDCRSRKSRLLPPCWG